MSARKDERIKLRAEAEIRKLRKLFEHLDGQRKTLVETFHMLSGPVTRADLRKRFAFTIKRRGFNVIASSLLDSCILGVTRLVRGRKSREAPLLFKLVEPFLQKNRNTAVLQILEIEYLDRDHYVPAADAVGGLWNEQQLVRFNAMKDNKRAELREEFWRRVKALSDNWDVLDRASKEFKIVRDKWIAHYEVRHEPTKDEFRGFDVPTIFEFYDKLAEAIALITQTVSDLSLVLNRTDISVEEFERIASRDANGFWEISDPE